MPLIEWLRALSQALHTTTAHWQRDYQWEDNLNDWRIMLVDHITSMEVIFRGGIKNVENGILIRCVLPMDREHELIKFLLIDLKNEETKRMFETVHEGAKLLEEIKDALTTGW